MFRNRSLGTIVGLIAAVMAVVGAIVYKNGYEGGGFYDETVITLAIVGAAAFVVLSILILTAPWASTALCVCAFLAFFYFVKATYLYLPDVFYGGVTMEAIKSLDKEFVSSALLLLGSAITANAAAWMS